MTQPHDNERNGEPLAGRVVSLAGLVAYQPASVVSRTLVQKKTGTVTLFAFDAGQGLSEHTAPFEALVCVLEGQAEITIAGSTRQVGAGEMVILPAGQPHQVQAPQRMKMLLVMIRS